MLVLTRKINESIIIGNNIEIKVLKMGKNVVELGIKAPRNYSIFREEVFKEIQQQNIEALKSIETGDIRQVQDLLRKKLGTDGKTST
jgi:carbon storage regulator